MATKIRLKRFGKKRNPFYRVVVIDSRRARNGKPIEEIGVYHPTRQPSVVEIQSERALYWLSVGAQPSETVQKLLTLTGDWGKFKGDEKAQNTVKPQPTKLSPEEKIKEAADKAEKFKQEQAKKREEAKRAAEEAAKAEADAAAAAALSAAQEEASDSSDSTPAEQNDAASSDTPSDETNESSDEAAEAPAQETSE